MHLVEKGNKVAPAKTVNRTAESPGSSVEEQGIAAAISLLDNIVEVACERERDLDLMRFVNLLDLYKMYLRLASRPESHTQLCHDDVSESSYAVLTATLGGTGLVSFEHFVRDSQLLREAASALSLETGEKVAVPSPLALSANN